MALLWYILHDLRDFSHISITNARNFTLLKWHVGHRFLFTSGIVTANFDVLTYMTQKKVLGLSHTTSEGEQSFHSDF